MERDQRARTMAWASIILVIALAGGSIWWLNRSRPAAAPEAASTTHVPCEPLRQTTLPASIGPPVLTEDWEISVTTALAQYEVPAEDGGRYRAAPGEVFLVVEVTFSKLQPGGEAAVSTQLMTLSCQDGTTRDPDGLRIHRKGFCRVCSADLGTKDRTIKWGFLYRMDRDFLGQPFDLRYANSDPIRVFIGPPPGL